MKSKLKKKIILTSLTIGSLALTSSIISACTNNNNALDSKQQSAFEITPTFDTYPNNNFYNILAVDFLDQVKNVIILPTKENTQYKFISANISAGDEDAVDFIIQYDYNNKSYFYKKTIIGFSPAKYERQRLENVKYLQDNKATVEIQPTLNNQTHNVSQTTVEDALKWEPSAFILNNQNKDLKYTVRTTSLTDDKKSLRVSIEVEKGAFKTLASTRYDKIISGFLDKQKLESDANKKAVDDVNNQLSPSLKDQQSSSLKRSEVLSKYQELFSLPIKEGFVYKFVSAKVKENTTTAISITIEVAKGEGETLQKAVYTRDFDGFASDEQ